MVYKVLTSQMVLKAKNFIRGFMVDWSLKRFNEKSWYICVERDHSGLTSLYLNPLLLETDLCTGEWNVLSCDRSFDLWSCDPTHRSIQQSFLKLLNIFFILPLSQFVGANLCVNRRRIERHSYCVISFLRISTQTLFTCLRAACVWFCA